MNKSETENKKGLKRINWNIIKNLLNILFHEGKMRKTTLARKSNMGYENCILYIDWLYMLDFIKKELEEDRSEMVSLSELGISFCTRKLIEDYKENNNSKLRNGMSQSFD